MIWSPWPCTGRTRARPSTSLILSIAASSLTLLNGCSGGDVEARRRAAGSAPSIEALAKVADASRGGKLFGQCAACHTIAEGAPDRTGPNLFGIIGKPVAGGSETFGYTYALKAKGGIWTRARLHAWLADPQRFAPGTQMLFPGLSDPIDRADVIAYLEGQTRPK